MKVGKSCGPQSVPLIATVEPRVGDLDDGFLVGPAGFTIDSNECPEGWINDVGLVVGVITIGVTTAASGSLAVYGNIYTGLGAYFDMVNDQGGIGGYTFEVIVKDDEYVAAKTIEAWSEFFQNRSHLLATRSVHLTPSQCSRVQCSVCSTGDGCNWPPGLG